MITAEQIGFQDVTDMVKSCCDECKGQNMDEIAPHPTMPNDSMHMGA